jgi:predicted secreted Zn-dependent protease
MIASVLASFLLAAPVESPVIGEPSIHDTIEYHDISGRTAAELSAALKRISYAEPDGDRYFAANTRWRLGWNFQVESPPHGRCRLTSATASLDILMNLPRWQPPRDASPPLVQRWQKFADAVRRHEDGHRDIAVEAAHELLDRISKTSPAPDCDKLKRSLGRVADATLREYRDKESSYDVTTLHGSAQGATFP